MRCNNGRCVCIFCATEDKGANHTVIVADYDKVDSSWSLRRIWTLLLSVLWTFAPRLFHHLGVVRLVAGLDRTGQGREKGTICV